jgi:uncharacterized coiled-coil protein SlyX
MAFLPVIDELKSWRSKQEEILAMLSENIAGGIATDYPEYRFYCGYIELLRDQIRVLTDRIAFLENTDKDKEEQENGKHS